MGASPAGRTLAAMKSVKLDSPTNDELLMRIRYDSPAERCGIVCSAGVAFSLFVLINSTESINHNHSDCFVPKTLKILRPDMH